MFHIALDKNHINPKKKKITSIKKLLKEEFFENEKESMKLTSANI